MPCRKLFEQHPANERANLCSIRLIQARHVERPAGSFLLQGALPWVPTQHDERHHRQCPEAEAQLTLGHQQYGSSDHAVLLRADRAP